MTTSTAARPDSKAIPKDFRCPECDASAFKDCLPFWPRRKSHQQREALTRICPQCLAPVGTLCQMDKAPQWQKVHYRRMADRYYCPNCCRHNPNYRVPVYHGTLFPRGNGPMPMTICCMHCLLTLALLPDVYNPAEARKYPAGDAG